MSPTLTIEMGLFLAAMGAWPPGLKFTVDQMSIQHALTDGRHWVTFRVNSWPTNRALGINYLYGGTPEAVSDIKLMSEIAPAEDTQLLTAIVAQRIHQSKITAAP